MKYRLPEFISTHTQFSILVDTLLEFSGYLNPDFAKKYNNKPSLLRLICDEVSAVSINIHFQFDYASTIPKQRNQNRIRYGRDKTDVD